MNRRFLRTPARELLNIARASSSVAILEEIAAELSERKNDTAFRVYLEVGRLIEQAKEREIREIEAQRQIERQRLAQRNLEGYFEWPSTDAPASTYGFSGDVFSYQEGLLTYVGYHVGRVQGVSTSIRQQILDCVFHNQLPRVQSPEYMQEWGDPRTAIRLHKLADTLASFTRNAKRRTDGDISDAIADWEYDLNYLHHKYYVRRFRFAWPSE